MLGTAPRGEPLEIFPHLDKRVNNRHQQRIEPIDRAALPRFSFRRGHPITLADPARSLSLMRNGNARYIRRTGGLGCLGCLSCTGLT